MTKKWCGNLLRNDDWAMLGLQMRLVVRGGGEVEVGRWRGVDGIGGWVVGWVVGGLAVETKWWLKMT
jgi:hypothetical protein